MRLSYLALIVFLQGTKHSDTQSPSEDCVSKVNVHVNLMKSCWEERFLNTVFTQPVSLILIFIKTQIN
jgi:hypothetical protein